MSDFRRDCSNGFDIVCRWIGIGIDWAFYIVLFPITYPLALVGRRERLRKEAYPPILISCHYRIEEREGYEAYKVAQARGDKMVRVRFLGSGEPEAISIALLDPSHFDKPMTVEEILAAARKKQ